MIESHTNIVVKRNLVRPQTFSLLGDMIVERGTKDDWESLHELHYKSEGKATGRVWRCMLGDQLVGVSVITSPRLLLAGRHQVFPKIKPGNDNKLTNTYRAKYINRNFGLASRIVVDTLFRASGVSYRMLNLVARMEGKKYMEIQSSMSKFNPFAIRAGFLFTKPKEAAAYEKGLALMTRVLACHPADHESVVSEIEEMTGAERSRVLFTLRAFYYRHSVLEKTGSKLGTGTDRADNMPVPELIRQIQQLVFAAPMYGVYQNPDVGRELPERLSLLAFDKQPTNQPLVLD